nr:hypothetical protein GCM10020063_071930 [Dactylosporangium thailandense]
MTECARVILCDPESTGGLTAPGAGAGRARDGAQSVTAADADGDEGDRIRSAGRARGGARSVTAADGDEGGRTRSAERARGGARSVTGADGDEGGRTRSAERARDGARSATPRSAGSAPRAERQRFEMVRTAPPAVGDGDVRGRTAHIGLERRTRAAGPSRVASGGGTARADRAVGVNRASGANRARVVPWAGLGSRPALDRTVRERAGMSDDAAAVRQVAA